MMSITWMVTFTVLIISERLLPLPAHVVRALAGALVVLGVALAALPAAVPALTIPPGAHPMTMPGAPHPMTMPAANPFRGTNTRPVQHGRTAAEGPHRR
jgi:hypothetical protein